MMVLLVLNLGGPMETIEELNVSVWDFRQTICGLSLFFAILCGMMENYVEG